MPRPKRILVRKITRPSGTRFQVDAGKINGKRSLKSFRKRADAEDHAAEIRRKLSSHGSTSLELSDEDRLIFTNARDRLAAAGASITQAVEFYLARHRSVRERLTLREAFTRCTLEKERQGLSDGYLATFASSVGSFVERHADKGLEEITREDVKKWILGNGWSPRTQRGYLVDLRSFFAWSYTEHYLAENWLASEKFPLAKMVDREPPIFSPEQIEKLFHTALHQTEDALVSGHIAPARVYRSLIGYLALATFAGIRPHELQRLDPRAVDLESGHVGLDARVAKTSDRRVVDLSPNCRAWLHLWRSEFPKAKSLCPPSWDRHLKRLRARAELRPWPHDVLRHSFASYYLAKHRDKAALQNQMGHSEDQDTLEKHYRAVMTPDRRPLTKALAEKFWEINPPARASLEVVAAA